MSTFKFLTKFLIFWHPWHPWACIRSVCWTCNLKQIEAIPPSVHGVSWPSRVFQWCYISSGMTQGWLRDDSGMTQEWLRHDSGMANEWLRDYSGMTQVWLRDDLGLNFPVLKYLILNFLVLKFSAYVSSLLACVSLLVSACLCQLFCVSLLLSACLCQLACVSLLASACLRHLPFVLRYFAWVSYNFHIYSKYFWNLNYGF